MARPVALSDSHPLMRWAEKNKKSREQTAYHFRVSYGVFRQIITGHTNPSMARSVEWEDLGRGAFTWDEVMWWHYENGKTPA